MGKQWNTPDREAELIEAVAKSKSISGVCRILGIAPRGGNINTIRKHITRLNLDVDHHTGMAWNKENYSKPSSKSHRLTLRAFLLREYGYICWNCKNSEWMGQQIPLEMDHIDGNNSNNELSNLRILCCNCHAQTPTFRNKKR